MGDGAGLLREALEVVSDGLLLLDADRRVVFTNDRAERVLGFRVGRGLEELLTEDALVGWRRALELAEVDRVVEGELDTPSGIRVQMRGRTNDEGRLALSLRPLDERTVPNGAEISKHYVDVLERFGIGVWRAEWSPDALWWSPRCFELLGIEPGPITQEAYLERVLPEDQEVIANAMSAAHGRTGEYAPRFRVRLPDGRIRHLQDRGVIVWDGDRPLFAVGATFDRSSEVDREARVAELSAELTAASGEGLAGRLALGVAHDLNNGLTVILGGAEQLLEDEALTPEGRESAAAVLDAARHAGELASRLLSFGRRTPLTLHPCELGGFLGRRIRLLRRLVPESVRLHLDTPDEALWVEVDVTRLEQVLTNLVVNAVQSFENEAGSIEIRAVRRDRSVVLDVEDDGPGVPAGAAERIFEPFYTTRAGGTGLGLPTVRGIIEQHGGDIEYRSTSGGGSTFRIRLPLGARTEEPAVQAIPAAEIGRASGRVWLIEDARIVRVSSERILRAAGHEVTSFADPRDALARVEAGAAFPDVLVTDVMLPGFSGPELVERLRARSASFVVVYVSGYAESLLDARGALPEGTPLLPKPFTREQLVRTVAVALSDLGASKA